MRRARQKKVFQDYRRKLEGNKLLLRYKNKYEGNIKVDPKGTGCEAVDCIDPGQGLVVDFSEYDNELPCSTGRGWGFINQPRYYQLLKYESLTWKESVIPLLWYRPEFNQDIFAYLTVI